MVGPPLSGYICPIRIAHFELRLAEMMCIQEPGIAVHIRGLTGALFALFPSSKPPHENGLFGSVNQGDGCNLSDLRKINNH